VERRTFVAGALALAAAPRSARAAQERRLAILAAPGDGVSQGDIDRFVARLGGAVLRKPGYTLVSRARLSAVLAEQGLSNSAYADPATAARLGKLIGASAILHVSLAIEVEGQRGGFVDRQTVDASSTYELITVTTAQITANGSADGSEERRAAAGGAASESFAVLRRRAVDACADDLVEQLNLR
jgi:hypothetical protein